MCHCITHDILSNLLVFVMMSVCKMYLLIVNCYCGVSDSSLCIAECHCLSAAFD